MRPLRMRFRPCATRRRLLASSLTTSATVPSATRSSSGIELGLRAVGERAARAQLGAQGEQHIEHHADAGQRLAGERIARRVRIDDHVGVGQCHHAVDQRGQVVVGDQHVEAARTRMGHAVEAGDAVVDGDQQLRAAWPRPDRRSPASGRSRAPCGRAPRSAACPVRRRAGPARAGHGTGGGAVAVVVGDDADVLLGGHRVGQQLRRRVAALQAWTAAAGA